MRVETVRSTAPGTWVLGLVGVGSERFRSVTLTAAELATLRFVDERLMPLIEQLRARATKEESLH